MVFTKAQQLRAALASLFAFILVSPALAQNTAGDTAATPAKAPPHVAAQTVAPPPPSPTGAAPIPPPPLPAQAPVVTPIPPTPAAPDDQAQVATVVQEVDGLKAEATKAKGDEALTKLRTDAAAAQSSAETIAQSRAKELAALNARLKRLSTSSGAARPHLTAAQTRERNALIARRARLTGQIKAAQQAGETANATYTAIAEKRREAFTSHIFERTASPLEAGFWTSLVESMSPDAERLARLLDDAGATAADAPEPKGALCVLVALLIALGLALPLRRRLKAMSRKRAAAAISAGGLRFSAHAFGAVLIDTLLPGAAAAVVNIGLNWGGLLSERAQALTNALVVAVFWGAAVLALSRQLAGARTPEERLLPVSERLAAHMRALPWLVALTTGAGFLLHRINHVVGASVAATIAANCVVSLAYAGVASLVLIAMSRDADIDDADDVARAPGRTLLSLVLTLAILVTVGAVFAGFTTFAAIVSSQIFWVSVIGAVAYLLLRFTDDAIAALFAPHGWVGRPLIAVLTLRPSLVAQIAVVISGVLQVSIVVAALSLALTPFGTSGDLLSAHLLHFGQTVHLGSIVISPQSVAVAVVSLVVGLGLVNLLERWVDRRFLPVTDWDIGVRTSVSTGIRYLGIGIVLLWALAAAGLGFRQIALVASALSVGIGFGLQQIVQNFVSGLILLVERPVKVGDWVNLGGVEGDVQRIRVRATEIRTFDKTTLIVPNSDLITKQVQNKTLGDPHGRVKLEVSVGSAADAPKASETMARVLADDPDVLKDPAPRVFIDSLTTGGSVNFIVFAYVATPRDGLRVKSDLYGKIIAAFAEAKIGFIGGPTEVVLQPGEALKRYVDALAASRAAAAATKAADADRPAPEPPKQTRGTPPASASS